ncbi:MAG TPA: DUF302 domain-containing protein [Gemmatimonadaceae bacterium]|nr:DUF302 domain-containing protein [Gemmatimonadaceae bacterium]
MPIVISRGRVAAAVVAALTWAAAEVYAQQPTSAARAPGVVTTVSAASFDSTLARLERAITGRGLTIAARVDHAAAAKRAGLTLRPTTLVIAGNPAAGTPLMVADQTMGVELPLRFLVWQAEDGKAHVTYDPLTSIAARHQLKGVDDVLRRMTTGIESIVAEAVKQ